MKVIVIRKYGQLVSGDEATRVNCQHWLDNKQVFCFDVFIIGPELRRNPPWWYLACTTECSALMLLLWEVWSNLACCVHCPLLLSPGSLWWWPQLTCPPSLLSPLASHSSFPHWAMLAAPVMWRLSLLPSSHCSMAQLSRTDCPHCPPRHVAVTSDAGPGHHCTIGTNTDSTPIFSRGLFYYFWWLKGLSLIINRWFSGFQMLRSFLTKTKRPKTSTIQLFKLLILMSALIL